jgi:hypothetical protein
MPRPSIDALLKSYPRRRPDLPPEHGRTYVEHYRANRGGTEGLSRIVMRLESWMHHAVAADAAAEILEIGPAI